MDNEKTAATAAKAITDFVNVMSHNRRQFAGQIMREHRTIQQQVFQLFATVIEEWAKQEHFDMRNEYTITKSREIAHLLNGGVPFI